MVGSSRISLVINLILRPGEKKSWYDLLRIHILAMDNNRVVQHV